MENWLITVQKGYIVAQNGFADFVNNASERDLVLYAASAVFGLALLGVAGYFYSQRSVQSNSESVSPVATGPDGKPLPLGGRTRRIAPIHRD